MKDIYLISWYFPSQFGGSEKSILYDLKEYKRKGYNVYAITFDELYPKGNFKIDEIKGKNYGLQISLSKYSRLYTLWINRRYILSTLKKYEEKLRKSIVITQNLIAPIVAEFCIKRKINYIYYLRDEFNLNEFHCYETGLMKTIKILKYIFELPAIIQYKNKNKITLMNAYKIISNSKFTQQFLKKKFALDSTIRYPKINYSELDKKKMKKENQIYITFIGGGNAMKGYDIVIKIAKRMRNEKFLIVGRYKKPFKKRNIYFIPFQKDVMEVYKRSKLILMPSKWNEAFGRVVVEANYLGIPVITSNKGGLPEANKYKNRIINDLEKIEIWVEKIKNILNNKEQIQKWEEIK